MPVKRRLEKRRNTEAVREAWCDVFERGAQLLAGTLQNLGFDPDDDEQIEAAWREFGRWYLENRVGMRGVDLAREDRPWALEVFGEP